MADTQLPTGSQISGAEALGLHVPTGTQVYDALMLQIDPELLTANIPSLGEKYRDETPEAKAERLKRYGASYARYDQVFLEWITSLHAAVRSYRHEALQSAEAQNQEKEATGLLQLQSQFKTAA
ncbi:TPA: hypothetical protein DCL30_00410 [Candidatus Peribacteria bacterium]|nr:MAG: hypothetical protein A3J91_03960 [Candidatus Peribacteria bacterium RIFOXYC2_FULL_58_10]OGJ84424.1 MAG: hypothetical protein A2529_03475 [Candidatus Peribacteria bacterium RIFOXYD2_FULL_58_15]HAI97992.1 hypothetical protein [Candidatus Peribacteria bacterium]HAS34642.1 hypothetical protein [Candidatus Peribacteria bacterium]